MRRPLPLIATACAMLVGCAHTQPPIELVAAGDERLAIHVLRRELGHGGRIGFISEPPPEPR